MIFLSFQGLPSSDALTILSGYGIKATFFLTADEIESSPATVRRIVGEGHNVGALCSTSPALEYAEVSSALWNEAHAATVLVASASREYDAACESWAGSSGLVFCDYNIDGVRSGAGITASELAALLSGRRAPLMYLRLQCCTTTYSNINGILNTLTSGSAVLAAGETSEA